MKVSWLVPIVAIGLLKLEIGVTVVNYLPPADRYETFKPLSPDAPYQQTLLAWRQVPAVV